MVSGVETDGEVTVEATVEADGEAAMEMDVLVNADTHGSMVDAVEADVEVEVEADAEADGKIDGETRVLSEPEVDAAVIMESDGTAGAVDGFMVVDTALDEED